MQRVIETENITGKVICGYQGWFAAKGDGSPVNRWVHWARNKPSPGNQSFELYPDISEYSDIALFDTGYANLGNGQPAQLFSSYVDESVDLHFKWMQQYGLDGVALQRFASELRNPKLCQLRNDMALKVKRAAEKYGRIFYVMYDVSGMDESNFVPIIQEDFKQTIKDALQLLDSSSYVHQNEKQVICLWGIGFTDRPGTPSQWMALIEWFQDQNCYVIGGVPTAWRESKRDSKPGFTDVYAKLDMISPWTIGRYATGEQIEAHKQQYLLPDAAYCRGNNIEYQPVIFPGFAWSNWNGGKVNHIPRRQGKFFWDQAYNIRESGIENMYIAMFDEYDEGTAIAKAASDSSMIPTDQYFLTLSADGAYVSSDYYLRLAGLATRMIKKQEALSPDPNIPLYSGSIRFRTGFEVGDALPTDAEKKENHDNRTEEQRWEQQEERTNQQEQHATCLWDVHVTNHVSKCGSQSLQVIQNSAPVYTFDGKKTDTREECALFEVDIPVQRETILEYFVYPVDQQSACMRMNVRFDSGRSLLDFEQEQLQMSLKVGQWNRVYVKLGSFAAGETIRSIGMYRANVYRNDKCVLYIDEVSIRDDA